MAGIGFELKKLFQKRGLAATAKAYGYAGVICTGPMLLGIVLLVGIAFICDHTGATRHNRELLNCMMDQVDRVLYDLKNNPYSRRIMTNIYVHQDLHEMNLYPCAYSMTFNVTKEPGKDKLTLNAVLNQRSQDILAANNWNVCQYSILLMMIAQVCDMEAGELVHVIADCHIYDRHVPVIKELISRTPYPAPTVKLNPEIKDFYEFTTDDLIVENYQTWPQIKNIPIAI